MVVCANCGAENREGARFCDSCGAPLSAAAPRREVRKVVTVLFSDVSGSTALGERTDPETLRRVMARYFETAKRAIERHGGTVEKFIGDAVMAVFGVPTVHEDDALRAVRAADELRDALAALNAELADSYGTQLALRTGVNTGEVVTGTEERLATGDAVNVAARLEQAAEPGDILLGEETVRLVRDAVAVEPVAPLELKGKAEPVHAYRLLSVERDAPAIARRHDAPMVGRERQSKLLEGAFANVVSERACALFTILGAAGVGKSRLAEEFLERVNEAVVARGRCPSYGEGISYWPVTEVVKQLLGADASARLAELGVDKASAAALAPVLGDQNETASADEIAWAVRKLFEAQAAERPLVVVFDDVHWGETTFLDLIEHVADFGRDAPILLLCLARPELLDRRPSWGGGKLNATTILLEPLARDETESLVESLVSARNLDETLRARILEAAGGNPLFVEEMVAMLAEAGNGTKPNDVVVPPTIQALLAARLDQLEAAERGVLERGAIEGQVFHRAAVAALAPNEPQIDGRLMALVRKDLVRPERAAPRGDAFRFRHLLIRDAAYEALSKATRAELHERFATWLAEHVVDLVELDEVVGYHLEQAYRYRAELGPLDDVGRSLASAAGERLLAAARRAEERGDVPAALSLFTRAVDLLPAGSASRRAAQLGRAAALDARGDFGEAEALASAVIAEATSGGDERMAHRAMVKRLEVSMHYSDAPIADALREAQGVAAALERLGDDEGLAAALHVLAALTAWRGHAAEADRLFQRALVFAERAGRPIVINQVRTWLTAVAWFGPTPTAEGVRRCDAVIGSGPPTSMPTAHALAIRGAIVAMQGRFDEARANVADGRAALHELGQRLRWAGLAMAAGEVELHAGQPHAAEELLAVGYEALRASDEAGFIPTLVGMRAEAAVLLGRFEDALRLADEAEAISVADDIDAQIRLRGARARALAGLGELEGAERAIGEAISIAEPTDYLPLKTFLAVCRADVERVAGRSDGERAALEDALRFAELKGDVVSARNARERLAALSA